jgi:uncharacterized protein
MTFMPKKIIITTIAFIMVMVFNAYASTPQPPSIPRDYVTDLAGIIRSDAKNRLNSFLQELEQKTTAQVLVLTVQSLDGQNIEEFAFNTKEKWKLGQKGKDNGVLIVVAVKDRKYRFEIGYGLESALPDSMVGSIGRDYLVPFFRKGDYSTGITNATFAIIQVIAAQQGAQITGMPVIRRQQASQNTTTTLYNFLTILFILTPIIIGVMSRLMWNSSRRSSRSMWWGSGFYGGSSGGFGGFSGGSFGGGGGGSGGGGGASGGW